MSWDIFAQKIPKDVHSFEEMREKYPLHKVEPIGTRSEIIAKIKEVVPEADFTDPSWGAILGPDYSIEISFPEEGLCDHFAMHVRGSDTAAFIVRDILRHLGIQAWDSGSETGIFEMEPDPAKSLRAWRKYRDFVLRRKE